MAPNSPVDYDVCSVMQQRVYQTPFGSVDEFKKRLDKYRLV